jgi:tripartite-type tricarboxylate transporter receptor subunit TctC
VVPAKTPPEIVARLNRETLAVLNQPDVREQFTKMGFEIVPSSPRDFTAYLAEEANRWGGLIRTLGIKAD